MSDHRDESAAVPWRLSAFQIMLVSIVAAPLGVLLVVPLPAEFGPAAGTVGFVLAEAMVLYVGYGVLTRVAGSIARELLGSA